MKKCLFLFAIFTSMISIAQTKFDPISVSINRITTSKDTDWTEYVYVSNRCAALNNSVGTAFKVLSDNQELGKRYLSDGNLFYSMAEYFSPKSGQTPEMFSKQHLNLVKKYTNDMKESLDLNNNFPNYVWEDVKSCEKVKPILMKKIKI